MPINDILEQSGHSILINCCCCIVVCCCCGHDGGVVCFVTDLYRVSGGLVVFGRGGGRLIV